MEPQKKTLIVTTIALLLVLVLVFGTIFYLVKFIQSRQKQTSTQSTFQTSTSSAIPTFNNRESTGSGNINTTTNSSNFKIYNGEGFQLSYPKDWGLLTCSNSQNFEFDPANSTDQLKIACDLALKPITVLVGSTNCTGEAVTLGQVSVIRSKTTTATSTKYRWCTKTTPNLDITHRVSAETKRAYSKNDFSADIEKIISTIRFSAGS